MSSKPSSNEKNVVANVSIEHNGELQIIRDFDRRVDVDKHMIMDDTFDEKAAKAEYDALPDEEKQRIRKILDALKKTASE